jgi:hypothetical protein
VAATSARVAALWRRLAGLLGGLLAAQTAQAVTLPENRAEAMLHAYDGGGVRAGGPAVLVRKSVADRFSLAASYYVDAVSNASIDVVTTASPFKETRHQVDLSADYVVRDTLLTVATSQSREPDYHASNFSFDVAQEVYGNMTTVSLGFTRGADDVGRYDTGFFDKARHWQYRLGVTQILSPGWLASANFEAISDDGYLGNPYRSARVFGAAVPERVPRTRSSRAIKLRTIRELGQRDAAHGEYRYFWDNWDIRAHTLEAGYSRYFEGQWLADGLLRYYHQSKALFYSDNASTEMTYVSRNRQLGTFDSLSVGAKLTYRFANVATRYDAKVTGSYEFKRFDFKDFTDIRTGEQYRYNAHLLEVVLSGTF